MRRDVWVGLVVHEMSVQFCDMFAATEVISHASCLYPVSDGRVPVALLTFVMRVLSGPVEIY